MPPSYDSAAGQQPSWPSELAEHMPKLCVPLDSPFSFRAPLFRRFRVSRAISPFPPIPRTTYHCILNFNLISLPPLISHGASWPFSPYIFAIC